jgi:hypothetical protein
MNVRLPFTKADLVQVAIPELPSLAVGVRRLQFLCKSIVGFLVNNKKDYWADMNENLI